MMKPITIRRLVRHSVAAALWAHTLFATSFLPSLHFNKSYLSNYVFDISLLIFIVFYGGICDFGWVSVWFDAFYIYLWPFVLLFKAIYLPIRCFWRKHIKSQPSPSEDSSTEKPATKKEDVAIWQRPINVFAQFSLLWCAIILHTQNRSLAIIATAASILGASKAVYGLWDFISRATLWVEKLKGSCAARLAKSIEAIRNWDEGGQSADLTNAANLLKIAETTCNFLADRKSTLVRLTSLIALTVTVPFYLYISGVFACAYLGIAKVEHFPLDFKTAMIDSLFIPIAFTDLPHSAWIRMIAGVQALTLGAMGYNVLFRHFNNKIDRLSIVADELRQPLRDQQLMQRVVIIANLPKSTAANAPQISEPAVRKAPQRVNKVGATKPRIAGTKG